MSAAPLTLFAALLAGLIGSGHCAAMCGGIAGALGLSSRAAAHRAGRALAYPLLYNAGRVTSYAIAGAVVGGIGAGVGFLRHAEQIRLVLQLVAGMWIVLVGLSLLLRSRGFVALENLGVRMWRRISPLLRAVLPIDRPRKAFVAGMVWGWLPCGMAYTMLIAAWLSTDALTGAAIMIAFGLGTLPALLLVDVAASRFARGVNTTTMRRIGGGAIALLGVFTLLSPWLLATHAHELLPRLAGCLPSWR